MYDFDLVPMNGDIITADKALAPMRWIGIREGKIGAMGNQAVYPGDSKLVGKIVDVSGKTVVPCFVDMGEAGYTVYLYSKEGKMGVIEVGGNADIAVVQISSIKEALTGYFDVKMSVYEAYSSGRLVYSRD